MRKHLYGESAGLTTSKNQLQLPLRLWIMTYVPTRESVRPEQLGLITTQNTRRHTAVSQKVSRQSRLKTNLFLYKTSVSVRAGLGPQLFCLVFILSNVLSDGVVVFNQVSTHVWINVGHLLLGQRT